MGYAKCWPDEDLIGKHGRLGWGCGRTWSPGVLRCPPLGLLRAWSPQGLCTGSSCVGSPGPGPPCPQGEGFLEASPSSPSLLAPTRLVLIDSFIVPLCPPSSPGDWAPGGSALAPVPSAHHWAHDRLTHDGPGRVCLLFGVCGGCGPLPPCLLELHGPLWHPHGGPGLSGSGGAVVETRGAAPHLAVSAGW